VPAAAVHSRSRQAPIADLALERGALGAAMLVPAQAEELIRNGHSHLFTASIHRHIFEAICSLSTDQLDYTLLIDELQRMGHEIPGMSSSISTMAL